MTSQATHNDIVSKQDENEIFKSLNHQIRRNIIRTLGEGLELSFSEIQKVIGPLDSPTLSYHLKSLNFLVNQDESMYSLTDVGVGAYLLLNRIDDNTQNKKGKKAFLIANIGTIVCWTIIMFAVPFLIQSQLEPPLLITIIILLNVVAQINFQISWQLWGRSWKKSRKSRKRGINKKL
ncbi:ArsR/SmtB family transcription factor [Candidatus Lokiarchaeum ossiferum]|uniref:ArsR/SmtB family transcription factor n=1 Tax=Candidatus Lokiarchaeum ossiferum TaxID=2951803 RepID=UPI00352F7338